MTVAGTEGVLLMAHGTPARREDLPGFYTEIRRGSPPPPDLLQELAERYEAIGGLSPLAARSEAQRAGVARALDRLAPGRCTVVLGTKFADPRIEAAVDDLVGRGCRRAVGVVLAPHSSAVSVGEYRRRTEAAADGRIDLHVVDRWHLQPGLVAALAARVIRTLHDLPSGHDGAVVVFTAHSVPQRVVDAGDDYPDQVRATAEAVMAAAGITGATVTGATVPDTSSAPGRPVPATATPSSAVAGVVAFQSAGRTPDPWVGPDLLDTIRHLSAAGAGAVVVCPVGFVSDHLEILYDLDIEAAGVARQAGMAFARTPSFDDDPAFCEVVAEVALEGLAQPRQASGHR